MDVLGAWLTAYAVPVGATVGFLQVVGQLVMALVPKHTIAWKISKAIVSGPQRPIPVINSES